jgi:hypothetical protein
MKPRRTIFPVILTMFCATPAFAGRVAGTLDAGGGHATNGNCVMDASMGGIGGIGSVGVQTARHGYSGQLTEVDRLELTGTRAQVSEGALTQLAGTAAMDDDTVTPLVGREITWSVPSWPLADIGVSGIATVADVYTNTVAAFNGYYLGVPGSGSLLVLDTMPDNYGTYAGDDLPDSWQYQYFGLDNPDAAPSADVTGTGQDNFFKYVAGLDPTNKTSVFQLKLVTVSGPPNQNNLMLTPCFSNRTYTPQFRTNLLVGVWQTLTNATAAGGDTELTITDPNVVEASKFYRIQVSYP